MSELARAVAFFEQSDDPVLLHELLAVVARRTKRFVAQAMAQGGEDAIPAPAEEPAPASPARERDARRLVERTKDFAELQALARAIGRRTETLEIAASAEFPAGARIKVPRRVAFPPPDDWVSGTVEATGTMLRVELDSGKRWEGPPSLARPAGSP
ncbi:MAG: hypothetical protein OXS47_13530 [Chloroflexota bacterium]|nr:hypothetical protein [Chloroflexota bacterium]